MWYAKMYFSEKKEVFQFDGYGVQGVPSTYRELPFLESLLSFLEMDCGELTPALRGVAENWERLLREDDREAGTAAMMELGQLKSRHIYLELLYVRCYDRFSRMGAGIRVGEQEDREMLEELFTYARLQDSDYTLETGRIDFGKCVCDTVFAFYDEFQRRGIDPKVDFCGGHLFVRANEEAVRRALQNLIRNALVHGHTGLSLELVHENGKAVFRCSNDVEHPEEIDIGRVFGRFYKADSARTHTSTGLGLSIAQGLVERMGGEIYAKLEGERFIVEMVFDENDVC